MTRKSWRAVLCRAALVYAVALLFACAVLWAAIPAHASEPPSLFWREQAVRQARLHPFSIGAHRPPPGLRLRPEAAALVAALAARHGVPVRLALAVALQESGLRCDLRDGIMQTLPRTARAVGIRGNVRRCATGAEAGLRYLELALARGGRGCVGLSLYNLGIYARPRCTRYGRSVLAIASRLS